MSMIVHSGAVPRRTGPADHSLTELALVPREYVCEVEKQMTEREHIAGEAGEETACLN